MTTTPPLHSPSVRLRPGAQCQGGRLGPAYRRAGAVWALSGDTGLEAAAYSGDQLEPGLELSDVSFAARRYSALMR